MRSWKSFQDIRNSNPDSGTFPSKQEVKIIGERCSRRIILQLRNFRLVLATKICCALPHLLRRLDAMMLLYFLSSLGLNAVVVPQSNFYSLDPEDRKFSDFRKIKSKFMPSSLSRIFKNFMVTAVGYIQYSSYIFNVPWHT